MSGTTVASITNKVNLLIAGLNKNFTAKNTITVGGQSLSVTQILAQLAPLATLEGNVVDTKNAWSAVVAAKTAGLPAIEKFVAQLIAALKTTLGEGSPLLASFGIAVAKPLAALSAVAKAVSTALALNTRVVRGTKSAKQKQAITTTGKPGLTVVGPSGQPLLTVGPVSPGSSEPATVTVGSAAAGSTPEASTATGNTAGATAPTTGSNSGA